MRLYECPIHDQDWIDHPDCVHCSRILKVSKEQEEVNKRVRSFANIPYQPFWGNADTEGGRWIEHLTPEPVFVRNKQELRNLMKQTHSMEK